MTAEWRHVSARFRTFLAELQPAAGERYAAWAAARDVGALLRRRFLRPELDGDDGAGDVRVIGGFGNGTAVRPAASVDLLFVVPARFAVEAGVVASPGGGADIAPLFRDMVELLGARYAGVEMSPHGWLSVVADPRSSRAGAGSRMAVRVVPCFAGPGAGYRAAAGGARAGRGPWGRIHPQAELDRLDRADAASNGKARDLIRMLKAWRRASGAALSTFALELLACEFVTLWIYQRQSALFYDWMVRDFFFWLTAQGGRTLRIPGTGETLALGDVWCADAEIAYAAAAEASDLERDNRDEQALAGWRRIFGLAFTGVPMPPPPPVVGARVIAWQARMASE
ncbi:MAG: hypothetical protein ACFCUO_04770 [Rhodospirillales bacterium]